MRIPVWLTLGVAALVLGFGGYRLYLAFRKPLESDESAGRRKGLYAMSKRTHLLIGSVYVLLGVGLIATTFGWNPLGGSIGPDPQTPPKAEQPSPAGSVPIDQPPQKR
jgi:hypothetical protein